MMKNKVLRKAWDLCAFALLLYVTVMFILGKADTMDKIYMLVYYSLLALRVITKIATETGIAICQYKSYKSYKNEIRYLQIIHARRYKACFTGTREEVKSYSKELEQCCTQFISAGREAISKNLLNKKQSEHLKEMINQAEILMTTEQSNIRGA